MVYFILVVTIHLSEKIIKCKFQGDILSPHLSFESKFNLVFVQASIARRALGVLVEIPAKSPPIYP
jgi:hypothetical protein